MMLLLRGNKFDITLSRAKNILFASRNICAIVGEEIVASGHNPVCRRTIFFTPIPLLYREKGPIMTIKTNTAALSLAGSLATALSLLSIPAASAGPDIKATMDKCYGIALKSQNDCAAGAGTSCAGTSKIDYDPVAWKYVAKGTCDTIKTPKGTGSLTPKS